MLGIADHSPAILTVLLDRTKYRMTMLDDPDSWEDKLEQFTAVENGTLTRVVFVVGVSILNAIRNAQIPLPDCKIVVFDEIDNLLSIDGIDLHDAAFNEDDEVWEFSKASNEGLNGALDTTLFGHVFEGEDTPELEAELPQVEDDMGGERATNEEQNTTMLPIFGAQSEEEETPEAPADAEPAEAAAEEKPAEEKPKRKRGRPPKQKTEGEAAEEKPKRRRGRPPKGRDELAELLSKRRPSQVEDADTGPTKKRRSKIDSEDDSQADETPQAAAPAYKIIEKSFSGRVEALVGKLQGNDRKEYLDALLLWTVAVLPDDRYTKVRNHYLDQLDRRRVKGTEGFIAGEYGNKIFAAFYDVKVFGTSVEDAAEHHKVVADDLLYLLDKCPDIGDKPKFQWKPDEEFIKMRKKQLRAKK